MTESRMRLRKSHILLSLVALAVLTLLYLQRSDRLGDNPLSPSTTPPPANQAPHDSPVNTRSHPISQLIDKAEESFESTHGRQSKTLEAAVAEYRRRYRLHPPPNFDKWYEFAKSRNVQMIDEYDAVYHSLLPFWALEPNIIRARTREALGFENFLIALTIRGGKVVSIEGGSEKVQWHRDALKGMLEKFVQYLPDMDVAFNIHDEPRVLIQADDLARHVKDALEVKIPAAVKKYKPKNQWSHRPEELGDGTRIPEVKITRFNRFAHQPTWSLSRMSCPIDSAARSLSGPAADNLSAYTNSPLGLVENTTAFSDICNFPSLERGFGLFERPNAFDVTHDLVPIFSQSKVSSFQDILYPSPWYWADRAGYMGWTDHSWSRKKNVMFWRGSTTGGFSRDGGWRHQHRQQAVSKINALDKALRLEHNGDPAEDGIWTTREMPRAEMQDRFDVHFTTIGQCDPGDCDAQKEYFGTVPGVQQSEAYNYKYLLDMDGNAFSGRYYAFLLSKSLVYKLAIFREWHDEWLRAWVHYVPLSWRGEEYVESVRYFDEEEGGKVQAQRLADQSRDWAQKVLRKEDMEVWFFRLLLEYGRLVDDHRPTIGFSV